VADLAHRFRLGLGQVIALVAAGFVPFLAFVAERWMTRRVAAQGADLTRGTHVPGRR
jgi:hypothetical protein